MGQFFAGANVAHRDEGDLAAHTEIGVARVVRVQHRHLALVFIHRRDKQIIIDLNLDRAEARRDFALQRCAIDDVTAFDRHDLVLADIGRGEQTASVDFALAHVRFRRAIGERWHVATE